MAAGEPLTQSITLVSWYTSAREVGKAAAAYSTPTPVCRRRGPSGCGSNRQVVIGPYSRSSFQAMTCAPVVRRIRHITVPVSTG